MKFTDTHTHIYTEAFDKDRKACLDTAAEAGIHRLVLPAIDSQYIDIQRQLMQEYPDFIWAAAGLHPSSVKEDYESELRKVKNELDSGCYLAVGEIGIDLYWDTTFKVQQKEAFERQVLWAKERQLPIIIHTRSSFDETYAIVKKHADKNLTGVFHSFTGTPQEAEKIMKLTTFKIGINGIVTFKNSNLSDTVKYIPPEFIVLETDSPYLAPTPKRGKRNESKHLIYTAQKIADIYDKSLQEISDITEQNAFELFKGFKTQNVNL